MKNAGTDLAAIGGIALFALVSAAPASADSGRYYWRHHWYDHKLHQRYDHWRHRNRPLIIFGVRPGRYFGVGPGSYECYGYDCNW